MAVRPPVSANSPKTHPSEALYRLFAILTVGVNGEATIVQTFSEFSRCSLTELTNSATMASSKEETCPMLNQESLSQLKGLKTQMEAEKERTQATVKGTQSRYGFAVLDDGREVFIPPQEMLKAFPEDRVQVCVRPTKDNKTIADIEKLLDSPLGEFTGRCVRKGKAFFVEPDLPHLGRWLFIPPHARNGVKEGDYAHSAVLRHPIRDGKPQAKILAVLGSASTPGIENQYSMSKYHLSQKWSAESFKNMEQILKERQPLETERRRDLTDLEFVSIDTAKTQDIDDALYAEISDKGWILYIAIADPTAYVELGSQLHREISARGTSVYFHGDVLPMMPEQLSQDTCALMEGVDRPALVCKIAIDDSGEVGEFEFLEARIRSRAKLSYYAVDRYLNGQYDELMSHATPLEALYQVYRALRSRRESHELVMDQRQEYRWILGEDKQIDSIEPYEKLLSQKLVEECMVATNRCAARFLSAHSANGPFVSHPGFRKDRTDEVKKFLQMHAPELAGHDPHTVEGYCKIMRGLSSPDNALPLRGMVNRLLTRAEYSPTPQPHMGMALDAYTNCTSPLRKYLDFLVHLQIKAVLHGDKAEGVGTDALKELSDTLSKTRTATLEAERWLTCNFLGRISKQEDKTYQAKISHVTSGGFNAKLEDYGLDGFVDLRKDSEKFSYDKWTASLTSTTRRFQLDQLVELTFTGLDEPHSWRAQFAPVPGCALKPPKVDKREEVVEAEKPASQPEVDSEVGSKGARETGA
jgi:VacB/RNase II family 3'-5' exoribonuclease